MLGAHLVVLPIVVPLLAGACAALFARRGEARARAAGLAGACLQFVVCLLLLARTCDAPPLVYSLGAWPAPFGIVLLADRLSSGLLVLTALLSLLALVHASSGLDGRGKAFHALWQVQVMGISGAFLTGDLFNLFVFFEVLLAASYALLLHGGGRSRVGATMHFMVVNLVASAVFLIAVSLLYSVAGTLNMAHLAQRIVELPAADLPLAATAGALLLAVFAVKTGLFPFHFWVPASYGSAAGPVVALIVAKVGAYCILRVVPLLFGEHAPAAGTPAAALAGIAAPMLIAAGVATMLVGALGALASSTVRQLAAMLTLISVGTMILPLAQPSEARLAAAIFYLVHSTLATASLFLLAEWLALARGAAGDTLAPGPALQHPAAVTACLLWAVLTAVGLPPSSGFIAKYLVLESLRGADSGPWLWTAVLATSFAALVACSRAISVLVWNVRSQGEVVTRGAEAPGKAPASATDAGRVPIRWPGWVPAMAVCAIVAASASVSIAAGPLHRQAQEIASQLRDRTAYRAAILREAGPLRPWIRAHPAGVAAPTRAGSTGAR